MLALVCYPSNGVSPAVVCEGITDADPCRFWILEIHTIPKGN